MAVYEELIGDWTSPPEDSGCALPIPVEDYIKQVRDNCKLDIENVKLEDNRDKIMVMVCGGTTSKMYLEDIRKKSEDDKYRIFCSNKTHDWLIDNGIAPDYHFIIDPKKSMLDYVQSPHRDVQYLIGSCCNTGVFKALEGYNVKRLVTFSGSENKNGIGDMQIIQALFDKGEYASLEGGTMAGLRAMTLANILGYPRVEFYGFDSCFFELDDDGRPIFYSYDKKRVENILECKTDDGKVYQSSPVFASQARQFIKWKHRLEWIEFVIHGDSLTAHINKLDEEAVKPKHDLLISDYMLRMNQELYKRKSKNDQFGVSGHENAGQIALLVGQLARKYDKLSVLDYGCGQGFLKKVFPPIQGVTLSEYDPCIEEYSNRPDPADVVVCTDVLEHVEMDCLENVLNDLQRLTKKICFVSVCLTPAHKNYSDGQNCHVTQLDFDIWYSKFRKRFDIVESDIKKEPGGHTKYVCVLQSKEVD